MEFGVAVLSEEGTCVCAASAAAAIDRDSLALRKLQGSDLRHEITRIHINVDRPGDMPFCILLRRPHVQNDDAWLVNLLSELLNTEVRKRWGSAHAQKSKERG